MNIQKNNRILIVFFVVVILILGESCSIFKEETPQDKAEANAVKFLESKFDGYAQECVDLLFDDLVDYAIAHYGYATEEVLVYAMNKELQNSIEEYKDKYGKKWRYEISVIDSYGMTAPEGYTEYECMEVVLKVEHTGRKLLFFKVDGFEEIVIQMIKKDDFWYVFSASTVLI